MSGFGRGAICLVAALWLSSRPAAAFSPSQWALRERLNATNEYVVIGEQLLHDIQLPEGNVGYHMPSASLQYALLCNHSPSILSDLARWAPLAIVAFLAFALAYFLFGSSVRAAAAAAAAFAVIAPMSYDMQLWYSALVMLVACFSAWVAQSPTPTAAAGWGASVGLSVLYRSPLAFLLPVFWLDNRFRRRSNRWLGPALAAFALVLLPWTWMNWRLFHELVLFERGETSSNIITAVVAYANPRDATWPTFQQSWWKIANLATIVRWAVGIIAGNPWGYAWGMLRRVWFLAQLQPVLLLLAAIAVWQRRRDPPVRSAALVGAYFAAIHLPMIILERYLTPLWPLASVLAVGIGAASSRPARSAKTFMAATIASIFSLVCLLGLMTVWKVLRFGISRDIATESRLAQEAEAYPKDPWPIAELGKMQFERGRSAEALASLRSAMLLGAGQPAAELDYSWLLAQRGWISPLERFRSASEAVSFQTATRSRLLKSLVYHRSGREPEALEQLRQAAAHEEGESTRPELKDLLESMLPGAVDKLRPLLESLPSPDTTNGFPDLTAEERAYLTAGLARWGAAPAPSGSLKPAPPQESPGLTDQALAAQHEGRRKPALRLLGKALAEASDDGRRADIALIYMSFGRAEEALKILSGLAARDPRNIKLRLSQARAAWAAGRMEVAHRALIQARESAKLDEELLDVALAYQDLALGRGDKNAAEAAKGLFERLVSEHPSDTRFLEARRVFLSSVP